MTKPYLEQNPIERAEQAKEHARISVADYHERRGLPTCTPTVIRDLETNEAEREG